MAKYRVACNATGFGLRPVWALLVTCDFIFTSNRYMLPVLDEMFPNARLLVMGQDMKDDTIRQLLLIAGFINEGDEIEVVSVLQLYYETIEKERARKPHVKTPAGRDEVPDNEEVRSAVEGYKKAVQELCSALFRQEKE